MKEFAGLCGKCHKIPNFPQEKKKIVEINNLTYYINELEKEE